MQNYGNGASTGLDQTASGKIVTGFTPEWLELSREDRQMLVSLAERVAEIAASPAMAEKRRLWRQLNMLQPVRPVVFCDPENGWNEIITESQMRCQGRLARRWEMDLRKEIFWGEEMGDDKPVEPSSIVPYTVSPDDWGMAAVYHRTGQPGLVRVGRADPGLPHRSEEAARAAVRRSTGKRPTAAWPWPATCSARSCPSSSRASGGGRWE